MRNFEFVKLLKRKALKPVSCSNKYCLWAVFYLFLGLPVTQIWQNSQLCPKIWQNFSKLAVQRGFIHVFHHICQNLRSRLPIFFLLIWLASMSPINKSRIIRLQKTCSMKKFKVTGGRGRGEGGEGGEGGEDITMSDLCT